MFSEDSYVEDSYGEDSYEEEDSDSDKYSELEYDLAVIEIPNLIIEDITPKPLLFIKEVQEAFDIWGKEYRIIFNRINVVNKCKG